MFLTYTSENRGQHYVRIKLHPQICAFKGQREGFGLYYPWNHSLEMVARDREEARLFAIEMLMHLKKPTPQDPGMYWVVRFQNVKDGQEFAKLEDFHSYDAAWAVQEDMLKNGTFDAWIEVRNRRDDIKPAHG